MTQEMARVLSLFEGAPLDFGTQDPNVERFMNGTAAVQNAIQCCCVIYDEKKQLLPRHHWIVFFFMCVPSLLNTPGNSLPVPALQVVREHQLCVPCRLPLALCFTPGNACVLVLFSQINPLKRIELSRARNPNLRHQHQL